MNPGMNVVVRWHEIRRLFPGPEHTKFRRRLNRCRTRRDVLNLRDGHDHNRIAQVAAMFPAP